MKRRKTRIWLVRGAIATALLVPLLLWLSGCWLFNAEPVAAFTVRATIIEVGEVLAFSAILSSDEDGIITKWEWDFGDGGSATGESVTHPYTAVGPYTVVLRVTDNRGATSTAQKLITVIPAGGNGGGDGPGPTATFTATPLTGQSPLTVTFNASASAYAGHAITAYFWDFGDGTSGAGMTTVHTYGPTVTTSYNVVLRIIAADNTEDTATKTITVTVAGTTPPANAPTASFTTAPNRQLAPLPIDFDPDNSDATAGRWLDWFFWTFGDGSSTTRSSDAIVEHRYVTDQDEEAFVATLTVIDSEGASDFETRTVIVENYQPVAGFEVFEDLDEPPIIPRADAGWLADDETHFYDVQTGPSTVWIQSRDVVTEAVAWERTTADPEPVGNENSEPGSWDDNNFSYDPEGQEWDGGIPAGFPNEAWGIETFRVRWGDGDNDTFDYQAPPTVPEDGDENENQVAHEYDFQPAGGEGTTKFTIEVTVWDHLDGADTFSRDIWLHTGPDPSP